MRSERTLDFWFCKLHFKKDLFQSFTINDFVAQLIANSKNKIIDGDKVWHLGGIKKEFIEDGREVLFGKIGKEIATNSKTIYDETMSDFIETETNDIYANYCMFVVDIKSYVIARQGTQRCDKLKGRV